MAREAEIDAEIDANDALVEKDDEERELDILNEMGSAPEDTKYTFRVSRVLGAAALGVKEPFLFEGDASMMAGLHVKLRDENGTGTYRVRVVKNNRFWKRFDISVEAPMKLAAPLQQQSEMATVLAAIERQNERMIAVLERAPQTVPAVVSLDPLTMLDKMMGIFQKLQPAQQPVQQQYNPEKAVELILKGVDLANQVGGGDREKGLLEQIGDALNSPVVAKLIEGMAPGQTGVRLPPTLPRPAATPQGNVKDTTVKPQPTAEEIAMAQAQQMRGIILFLLDKARRGSSFETYAEWAFDTLPPTLIRGLLVQSDPYQELKTLAPEIVAEEQWFRQLIDDLRKLVNNADAADHIDSQNASGPISPVNSNGNAGRQSGGGNDFANDEGIGEPGED